MKFKATNRFLKNAKSDCLCLPIFKDSPLLSELKNYDIQNKKIITKSIKATDFKADVGDILPLSVHMLPKAKYVFLLGMGKPSALMQYAYARALDALITYLETLTFSNLSLCFEVPAQVPLRMQVAVSYFSELLIKRSYRFKSFAQQHFAEIYGATSLATTGAPIVPLYKATIHFSLSGQRITTARLQQLLEIGAQVGAGANSARFLGDLPANHCTPRYLVEFCQQLAQRYETLQVNVMDEQQLAQRGMGAFLSVAAGGGEPPRLIELRYSPPPVDAKVKRSKKRIALVGKGVTFDTGGISLKPSAAMDEMKYDMCGAASVIGTMQVIAATAGSTEEIVGIVVATQNMPSATATKPGDVVKSLSGQSIEILNTDAEGRLILADALSYVQQQYQPTHIVDIATLTGACVVALGHYRTGMMSNDTEFSQVLQQKGDESFDPCWSLPMDESYGESLASDFADFANIGVGRAAGTVVAAKFLQKFVAADCKWVHLDIAGTAWHSGKAKGATGRPVPMLSHWLLNSYSDDVVDVSVNQSKKAKRGIIGPIIEQGLMNGESSHSIIQKILKAAPTARTTPETITFYANRLRKQGKPIPLRQRGRKKNT